MWNLQKIKNFWILCELLFWNVFGSSRNMKWWYQNGSFKGIYLMELLKYNDTRAFNFTFDVLLTSNKHIYFYIDTKVTNKLIKERRIPSWHVICQFKIFFKWYSVCLGMIVCDNFAWLCLFRTFTSKIYMYEPTNIVISNYLFDLCNLRHFHSNIKFCTSNNVYSISFEL